MLLSSVVLLLQETLEAALLVSVLMAVTFLSKRRAAWMGWGLAGGLLASFLYASNMTTVSAWFDYVGQEVINALLQISIGLALSAFAWTLARHTGSPGPHAGRRSFQLLAAVAVALAITREGSEVVLYLNGFLAQSDKLQAVLMGSGIGFSIGLSLGVLLFYGLVSLAERRGLVASVLLLALVSGNMLAQASLQLIQADWLASTAPLWDTSSWVSEHSITGQLLYALIGYEATPSPIQVVSYIGGAALVLLAAAAGRKHGTLGTQAT